MIAIFIRIHVHRPRLHNTVAKEIGFDVVTVGVWGCGTVLLPACHILAIQLVLMHWRCLRRVAHGWVRPGIAVGASVPKSEISCKGGELDLLAVVSCRSWGKRNLAMC